MQYLLYLDCEQDNSSYCCGDRQLHHWPPGAHVDPTHYTGSIVTALAVEISSRIKHDAQCHFRAFMPPAKCVCDPERVFFPYTLKFYFSISKLTKKLPMCVLCLVFKKSNIHALGIIFPPFYLIMFSDLSQITAEGGAQSADVCTTRQPMCN